MSLFLWRIYLLFSSKEIHLCEEGFLVLPQIEIKMASRKRAWFHYCDGYFSVSN